MPNIYRRGDRFYIDVRVNGERIRRAAGETAIEALELLREVTGEREFPKTSVPATLDSYTVHLESRAKPKSVTNARLSTRRLLEHFGDADASELTARDLDRFVQWRRTRHQVRNKTINGDLIVFRAALNHAVEVGDLEQMPIKVKLLRAPRKKEVPILTPDQIDRLLQHATDPCYGIILIAASTAFRASEILHLQWDNINFRTGQISITAKDGWSPKSYEERSVYVSARVISYLRGRKLQVKNEWVFPNSKGLPLDPSRTTRWIRRVFERAGLYVSGANTLHRIRHSVASTLLGEGVDLETVRQVMGHADGATTMLYTHSSDERMRAAARRALV